MNYPARMGRLGQVVPEVTLYVAWGRRRFQGDGRLSFVTDGSFARVDELMHRTQAGLLVLRHLEVDLGLSRLSGECGGQRRLGWRLPQDTEEAPEKAARVADAVVAYLRECGLTVAKSPRARRAGTRGSC